MLRTAAGDRRAFGQLADRHGPAMLRLARAILGAEALAQDATQESLLLAFRRAATYRPEVGPVLPWLLSILRREAYRLRETASPGASGAEKTAAGASGAGQTGADARDEAEPSLDQLGLRAGWSADDPEALLARAEQAEHLSWAIASLPARDREVLILRDVEGLSGEETAEVLDLDLAGMKSRLHRARLKLLAAAREGSQAMSSEARELGGLTCGQVLEVLSDYVDGALDEATRDRVEAHLQQCSVCERFGGRFRRTVAVLRNRLGAPPAVDGATYHLLMEQLLGKAPGSR